jgi:hypothetical protein
MEQNYLPALDSHPVGLWNAYLIIYLFIYLFIYFVVLGIELRAYTLSHSTSPLLG